MDTNDLIARARWVANGRQRRADGGITVPKDVVYDEFGQPHDGVTGAKLEPIAPRAPSLAQSLKNIAWSPWEIAKGAAMAPIHAAEHLFGTPSHPGTFPQGPDAPGNADAMRTLLLSTYGGNALNPGRLLEGAPAREAIPTSAVHNGKYFSLSRDEPDFSIASQAPFAGEEGVKRLAYDILNREGDDAGRVELALNPTIGQGYVDNITLGGNEFGTAGMRDVVRSLHALHPEIFKIYGDRTSGARAGTPNPRQTLNLFSDTGKPSIPGAIVAGSERLPDDYWDYARSATSTVPGRDPLSVNRPYVMHGNASIDEADRMFAQIDQHIPVDMPTNELAAFETPYDRAVTEQAWRDKIKRTGELYSNTGMPSLCGSAIAGSEGYSPWREVVKRLSQ